MNISNKLLGPLLFIILGILFLFMAGIFTDKLPEQYDNKTALSPSNQQVKLESQLEAVLSTYTGTVVAEQSAVLSSRIIARVAEILVEPGDKVLRGDVLIRLESADLDARVIQNEQAVSAAQAQLNAARKEHVRVQTLVEKKLLSQSQLDKAESQLKTANSNFRQAQASVTEAQTTFGYSVITAPFDGLITAKTVNVGDTASIGTQLLSMYNPNSLQLQVDIPESVISSISLNDTLEISIPTFGYHENATVEQIQPSADKTSRSFVVKLTIGSATVYPGSYGVATVKTGEEYVLRVPEQAVHMIGQLHYVDVIEDNRLQRRLVQLGDEYRVRQGLESGDSVQLKQLNTP
ncbi:efflux RND transporter periplasmic adaptor subunit [Thaumasiovibrio sp. DFM-14]|uniref:efflux RND transporter periplasmic adaptor subunit n=1 Tax=Thaumasiovibrio sp. DFM-14 TaxID=3384792 RepID=UPI00399FD66C